VKGLNGGNVNGTSLNSAAKENKKLMRFRFDLRIHLSPRHVSITDLGFFFAIENI
jgi:hypothetical protein